MKLTPQTPMSQTEWKRLEAELTERAIDAYFELYDPSEARLTRMTAMPEKVEWFPIGDDVAHIYFTVHWKQFGRGTVLYSLDENDRLDLLAD